MDTSSADSSSDEAKFIKLVLKKVSKKQFKESQKIYSTIQHTRDCILYKNEFGVFGC